MEKTVKEKSKAGVARKERLAAELRANLKRRKTRARDAQISSSRASKHSD